jgi:hypothetical protein
MARDRHKTRRPKGLQNVTVAASQAMIKLIGQKSTVKVALAVLIQLL